MPSSLLAIVLRRPTRVANPAKAPVTSRTLRFGLASHRRTLVEPRVAKPTPRGRSVRGWRSHSRSAVCAPAAVLRQNAIRQKRDQASLEQVPRESMCRVFGDRTRVSVAKSIGPGCRSFGGGARCLQIGPRTVTARCGSGRTWQYPALRIRDKKESGHGNIDANNPTPTSDGPQANNWQGMFRALARL